MFTLILASKNEHKVTEILPLIGNRPIEIKSLATFKHFPEIKEDGHTFSENAAVKAQAVFNFFKQPVIADDSGLEVAALKGAPGIYSARYAGAQGNYLQNNLLLLENMQSLIGEQRRARFVCTICFKTKEQETYFTGITEGYILQEFRGESGFGYDPLFFIPELNKTYAQLSLTEKNEWSHRGKAVRKLLYYLDHHNFY